MRYGVAIVLSTMSGTPLSCATRATPSMSSTSDLGLEIVSAKNSLVLGRTAAFQDSRSLGSSTKLTWRPNFGSVCLSRLKVPPYSEGLATTWSPASATLRIARVSAAWPEATRSAPTPPSREATRCSTASWVGFMIRV